MDLQSDYYFDQLFDQDVDQLLGIDQHSSQQQQQQPTAMDWMFGEYADAAAGLDGLLALDDLDSSSSSSGGSSPPFGSWLDEGYGSSSSKPAGSATAADELPSADLSAYKLERLIKQYSWNADQPELLQAVLAAGLYPNFAYVEAPDRLSAAVKKDSKASKASKMLMKPRAAMMLNYTDPVNGLVAPHPRSALWRLFPKHR